MSDAKGQHEPSMEEILASIRRIIAEDGETPAETPAAAAPAAPAQRPEEILELTDVVDEEGTVVVPPAAAAPAAKPPPRVEPEPPPPPPPPPPAPPPLRMPEGDDRLVSGGAAAASVAALSQLATAGAPPRERQSDMPLGAAGKTLEELVRELLRPLLKEWLDTNLPPLVERVVQEEIRRMAREAFGR
jgi:hypothetical protein